MPRIICITLSIFIFNITHAQLYVIKKNGRWGAINLNSELVIPAQYDFVKYYPTLDLAIVKNGNFYELFDKEGIKLLSDEYQRLVLKKDGHIFYLKMGKWGVFSPEKMLILKPQFDNITTLNADFFKTKIQDNYGLVKKDGESILENNYQTIKISEDEKFILFQKNDLWGLLDKKGWIIKKTTYQNIQFEENYIIGYHANKNITVFEIRSDTVLNTNIYPNQVAWDLKKRQLKKQKNNETFIKNPELKKPVWQKRALHYHLTNGIGQPLLKYKFFDIITDPSNTYTLARYGNKKIETIECFYIDHNKPKILWKIEAKFVLISDFEVNDWARITVDTLYDGLVNKNSGQIIRDVKYQNTRIALKNIGTFKDGLAWVYDGKKYGYINKDNVLVLPFIFDRVADFEDGLAIVSYRGKFGCINDRGKTVLPFEYFGITPPKEGLICVKNAKGKTGKWGAVDLNNNIVIPFDYTALYPFNDGKAKAQRYFKYWGMINKNNREVVPIQIACDRLSDFKNGIATISKFQKQESTTKVKVGYANNQGKIIIPLEYDLIENFDSIWALKRGLTKIWKGNHYGYIDYEGRIVVDAAYSDLENFEDNWGRNEKITRAKIDDLYGLLDHNGDTILSFIYCFIDDNFTQVWNDSTGLTKACLYDLYGYLNYEAESSISFNYNYASDIFNGYIIVNKKDKWGVVDTLEDVSITLNYDKIDLIPKSVNLVRLLKNTPTFYYYTKDGQVNRFIAEDKAPPIIIKIDSMVLYSPNYNHVTPFDRHGLAVVKNTKKNDFKAILSNKGHLVTKFTYIDLGAFHDSLAYAKIYNKKDKNKTKPKYGYINMKTEFVIPAIYTHVQDFREGLAGVSKGGRWGYIDRKGEIAIPLQYKRVTPFTGGYAIVNESTIIDEQGEIVGKLDSYTVLDFFRNARSIVESRNFQYHITPNGKPAYAARYDEVTPFLGEAAFVKKGELWVLKRQGPFGEMKLKFNKQQKEAYIKKYGFRRKNKNKYGDFFIDQGWEKITNGKWRLINKDGEFLTDIIFDDLEQTELGTYRVKVSRLYAISKLNGTFITELDYPVVRLMGNNIVKIESKNRIGYLKTSGEWLWEPQN